MNIIGEIASFIERIKKWAVYFQRWQFLIVLFHFAP